LQIDEPTNDASSIDLEREFVVQYYKAVTRLNDTLKNVDSISVDVYFRLLKRLAQGISVSFSGEPLSGLQVMGVLETRVLDFENIILLSMNEGVFPLKSTANSFIPYTLRKGFGMPTYEHQDSTYAYHFYRMIGRAKRIFMLYDTRTEGMQTGEVSRYFTQLKFLYGDAFDIRERVATYNVFTSEIPSISIEKTPPVMRKLDRYRAGGDLWLSASHLNNYINCSLQFYFSAIEGLSDEEVVSEKVESDVFGSIFHRVMEQIYRRYENQIVTPDVLSVIIKDDYLNTLIEKAFARYYFRDDANVQPLIGENYLIGEVIRSYVKQTLEVDKSFTPFRYIGSEYKFETAYRVSDDLAVQFKGSIDRIDMQREIYRIVDYKTGKGGTVFSELSSLFDTSRNADLSKILQVFLYSFFYDRQFPGRKLSPALYFMRSIYSENFDPFITVKADSNKNERVNDVSIFFEEFADLLNQCLSEMFNPDVPFKQTDNEKNCQYCPFKALCGK
jgi:ATP-dependent helicase/DNAse subunit B